MTTADACCSLLTNLPTGTHTHSHTQATAINHKLRTSSACSLSRPCCCCCCLLQEEQRNKSSKTVEVYREASKNLSFVVVSSSANFFFH
ncbi:uncharacterized protein Dwil_GK27210, partial [Drosophila willistoni]